MPKPRPSPADAGRARSLGPLRGLLPFFRPYRGRVALAALFLVLAAASTLLVPVALKALVDQGLVAAEPGERLLQVRGHFLTLFAVGVALAVFSAARFFMVSWIGERITADLRDAVYRRVLRQSPAFFETNPVGELLSRLTTDTTLVQTLVGSSLSMGLRNAVMGVGALLMLVVTNPVVMAQVLGILVGVVLPAVWAGRKVRALSRASQDRVADSSALAAEVLAAMPVVQAHGQQAREAARFADTTERAFGTAVRRTRLRAVLVAFIIAATFGALLWGLYQGTQAVLNGDISAGHLGQTVVFVIILVGSVAVLAEVWGDLLRAAGASERLLELLAAEPAIQDPAEPLALPPRGESGVALHLEGLRFAYPSRPGQWALDGVTLQVKPGETVALVGPSGAGKSTIFQLLLRFHEPQAGQIRVDGVPIPALSLDSLRGAIALVPQEPTLFAASALDNIRYGRPEASEAEVVAAAQAAQADAFLRALPEGYASALGERGVRLSGGQRQRVAIARAILRDAPLLLLDEATSALDSESERAVQAALAEAMRGRTTLVIAHRLSTVQHADRIVVMDQGRVVDIGPHAVLLTRCPLYARLAAAQFAEAPAATPA